MSRTSVIHGISNQDRLDIAGAEKEEALTARIRLTSTLIVISLLPILAILIGLAVGTWRWAL